jgi:hypothetical protein
MFIVYGQRFHAYDLIIDLKSGEVLDDGQPKKVKLSQWADESVAKHFAENVKNSVPKRMWKIWVE